MIKLTYLGRVGRVNYPESPPKIRLRAWLGNYEDRSYVLIKVGDCFLFRTAKSKCWHSYIHYFKQIESQLHFYKYKFPKTW